MPEVTVLMPVYNGEKYLKYSTESILSQSYRDFEFLIVNDCSRDQSLSILQSYHDPRIVIHTNEKNLGQTKSLNIGLKLARGKFVARIDADDMAFPLWLEKQLDFIHRNLELAVASTKAVVIDEHNRSRKILHTLNAPDDILLRILTNSPINHVGCLMKKDVILGVGGYPEDFIVAADYELWSQLIRRGYQITSTTEVLMAIRVHNQSVSIVESKNLAFKEIIRVIGRNFLAFANWTLNDLEQILMGKLFYDVLALNHCDFLKGIEVLQKVYQSLIQKYSIDVAKVNGYSRKQVYKIYIKRIFEMINHQQFREVHGLVRDYFNRQGCSGLFVFLFVASLGGGRGLLMFPRAYEILSRFLAILRQPASLMIPKLRKC